MMTLRTKDAFYQLEKLMKTPEQKLAFKELKATVTLQLDKAESDAKVQAHLAYRSYSGSFLRSVSGQRVLARAMRQDPVATELDLIEGGQRDLASVVGAEHTAEVHRQQQSLPGVLAQHQSQ